MYAFIKGVLRQVESDHLVIENNGIGYMVYVPFNGEYDIPDEGEELFLYTHYHASENGVTLFGFFSKEDKKMFLSMTTVSGIGPKGAISILSTLSSREIVFAILNDDEKAISKAPGIGAKTARRMILDLKDKLDISQESLLEAPGLKTAPAGGAESGNIGDAIMALNALGYGYAESARAVKGIENAKELSVEELLSMALKELI